MGAEHREPALGLSLRRFVLQNVPMLGETVVFHADDIGGDPRGGAAIAREAPMRDDVVALGDDQLVLVPKRIGKRADEVEEPVAAGRYMERTRSCVC